MFQNSALPSVSVDITRNIAGSLPRMRAWQGLAQLDHLLPLPRTFREYLVWLLMMAGVTALALLQVSVTLQISQAQVDADRLNRQYVLVEQQNAQLLWEISHFTTLERVQSEAVAAGFVPALSRRYVDGAASTSFAPVASSQPGVIALPVVSAASDAQGAGVPRADALPSLWDGWATAWAAISQSLGQKTVQVRDSLQEHLLKIDLSRYIWIGSPHR